MASPPHSLQSGPALSAFEPLADYYDVMTAAYAHDRWVAEIERELEKRGLGGPRVLDVACGTGKSALPWKERGYHVTACDLSPAMLQRAQERLGLPAERLFAADMRDLRSDGEYDVVTCLDDSLNYLLTDEDRAAALRSMARALRPGGALVFDLNTELMYRERCVGEWETVTAGLLFRWHGWAVDGGGPGGRFDAELEVFSGRVGGESRLAHTVHRARHHTEGAIRADLEAAGMTLRARLGQASGVRLSDTADEHLHPKVLHLAQRLGPGERRGA